MKHVSPTASFAPTPQPAAVAGQVLQPADLRRRRSAQPQALRRQVTGTVVSGRGNARVTMLEEAQDFYMATGDVLVPGSLNVVLSEAVFFDLAAAKRTPSDRRLLWRIEMFGHPVWAYRWPHAPLHVVEVLAPFHLRDTFGLHNGDPVALSFPEPMAAPLTLRQRLAWSLLWRGREAWCYHHDAYYDRTRSLAIDLGATQRPLQKSALRAVATFVKRGFK